MTISRVAFSASTTRKSLTSWRSRMIRRCGGASGADEFLVVSIGAVKTLSLAENHRHQDIYIDYFTRLAEGEPELWRMHLTCMRPASASPRMARVGRDGATTLRQGWQVWCTRQCSTDPGQS